MREYTMCDLNCMSFGDVCNAVLDLQEQHAADEKTIAELREKKETRWEFHCKECHRGLTGDMLPMQSKDPSIKLIRFTIEPCDCQRVEIVPTEGTKLNLIMDYTCDLKHGIDELSKQVQALAKEVAVIVADERHTQEAGARALHKEVMDRLDILGARQEQYYRLTDAGYDALRLDTAIIVHKLRDVDKVASIEPYLPSPYPDTAKPPAPEKTETTVTERLEAIEKRVCKCEQDNVETLYVMAHWIPYAPNSSAPAQPTRPMEGK